MVSGIYTNIAAISATSLPSDFFQTTISRKQSGSMEIMINALGECRDEEVRLEICKFEAFIGAAGSARAPTSQASLVGSSD